MAPGRLDPEGVCQYLLAGGETAPINVREKRLFGNGHILLSVNAPLRLLETELPRLVPGRTAHLILCDDGSSVAERASDSAGELGYTEVSILDGGVPG